MPRKSKRSRRGFTLLEIMVSLAIISISLVTLLSAHNRALSLNAEAARLTDAVTLAREEMEKFYFEPLPESHETGATERKKREDYPAFEWRSEIEETPFDGVVEARVTVFDLGGIEERPLVSLKAYISR